jgi:hypothetical protein
MSDLATAKIKYLLNCRLMDRTDPVYVRYCTGEKFKTTEAGLPGR